MDYGINTSLLKNEAASIKELFIKQPPRSIAEAGLKIKELTGIERSNTRLREFMKRHKFRFLKTGHIPAKVNTTEQKNRVEETLKLFIKSGSRRVKVHFVVYECDTLCLAAVSLLFVVCCKSFYKSIARSKPYQCVDNARYQHCFLVTTFAKSFGIHLLFLRPYSPNLNIIERLWKFTNKEILYAHYYDSLAMFHNAINSFFQNINRTSTPKLQKLLTLNFQFFDKNIAHSYTARSII